MSTPGSVVNVCKKYDCPTDETYQLMLNTLKLKKGEKGDVEPWEKKKIVDNYGILTAIGQEFIISKKTGKPLLMRSKVPDILLQHHDESGHPGRMTVVKSIQDTYHNVPHLMVKDYIEKCQICASRRPIPKPAAGMPITSKGTMHRLQADLIDMRSVPDGEFKWILQVKDHFSKFIWVYPLPSKECPPIAERLRSLFYQFGAPRIFQTDNGGEFRGSALQDVLSEFPCIKHIRSRPRHPETNGLIERANQTLENRIGAWMQGNSTPNGWATALERIAHDINRSYSRTINNNPFNLMLTRIARDSSGPIIEEESSDPELLNDIEMGNEKEGSFRYVPENENEYCFRHLLFLPDPPQAIAIGYEHTGRWAKAQVRGQTPTSSDMCFGILEVLADDPSLCGKLSEPMTVGSFIFWKKDHATNELGSWSTEIKRRIPSFIAYLKNRQDQRQRYEARKAPKRVYENGDVVAMKIPRVHRSNTCPKNMSAKVVAVENNILTLQTTAGTLQQRIHQDKVSAWPSPAIPPDLNTVAPSASNSISIINAFRSNTSYNPQSICNCKRGCGTKSCRCFKGGLKCGTKCHRGSVCSN